ncbi:alpha/beta hydrolase family protein [Chitinophaga nivalis]|uniref:Prolyl oligopeptidase family serine peptidase n=1 Tax=Chitinophaga nivalis TaxID=2991709 RepID=A0ABT3IX22_9BACT|nr:prolyl oligopeptidase family serine peptidase [Chitinophaga nivalis]MCW3462034.1 prolyl oligopeptidase family serine peptidase [Chitinophaga nivalis]MCW3488274.1 prolyl oligopeptidase family serine peptidase [Chitinophaga nivalis]
MRKLILSLSLLVTFRAYAQDALKYQTPPQSILELAMAAPSPSVSFNSKGDMMLVMERTSYPTIEDLSQPEYRLAGDRINPANFGPSRASYVTGIRIRQIGSKKEYAVTGLPAQANIGHVTWSPSEKSIAFTVTDKQSITLWKASVATGVAKQQSTRRLNDIAGNAFTWIDEDRILVMSVPATAGPAPVKPIAPEGPTVQQTSGKAAPAATYQDMLKNPYDEQLFDYYFQSEPVIITDNGEQVIGKPAIYTTVIPSPDNQYLLVETLHRPYSYLVGAGRFPTTISIWKINGEPVKQLASNPLDEVRPKGFDATSNYPRAFAWRSDVPATITWAQALDGGDPKKVVPFRDAVHTLAAPFTGASTVLVQTTDRFAGITWGNSQLALVKAVNRSKQTIQISRIDPAHPEQAPVTVIDRSENDRYNDPGTPVTVKNEYNREVLYVSPATELLMSAPGASPEGDRPFLAKFSLKTKQQQILWRSQAPYYEQVVAVADPAKLTLVTTRESVTAPVNYYLADVKKKTTTALTAFPHPQPQLQGVQKQLLKYKRKDGVDLTAMLYLPKGYDPAKDGRLPVLMWAYPREYKSASDAAQVRGSAYKFTRVTYGSPIFWVTRGFAVMDATEMPIVGEGDKEPNDSFIEQLVMNAEAAVGKITEMGVGDKNRIAVGGHSYGAFMTSNLLAHTSLFKAGLARSGAYNRTLTPFGFQNEQRSYWQIPDVYYKMSPFSYADKLKTPLLLIHGEADNNSGTFPIQSERLYNAIKGNGGTARLVFLPQESHGYAAKESILHMLWEMDEWLMKYVK